MADFPCIVCCNDCIDDTIQCVNCKNWVHRKCVPMSHSMIKTWSGATLDFLCRNCCFKDNNFSAADSLYRLACAEATGSKSSLVFSANSEIKLLETYGVNVRIQSECRGTVDHTSLGILQMFQPSMIEEYVPLYVIGDGNCLYRAVSRALYGDENQHALLRLRTALEIISHRKFYDSKMRTYTDLICDNRIFLSDYFKLIGDAINIGSYSEMGHIFALSAALGIPIRSYYPPQLIPELSSEPYSRIVYGRNVPSKLKPNVTIMWTQAMLPRNAKSFVPNHFVCLSKAQPEICDIIELDDTDNSRHDVVNQSGTQSSYTCTSEQVITSQQCSVEETNDTGKDNGSEPTESPFEVTNISLVDTFDHEVGNRDCTDELPDLTGQNVSAVCDTHESTRVSNIGTTDPQDAPVHDKGKLNSDIPPDVENISGLTDTTWHSDPEVGTDNGKLNSAIPPDVENISGLTNMTWHSDSAVDAEPRKVSNMGTKDGFSSDDNSSSKSSEEEVHPAKGKIERCKFMETEQVINLLVQAETALEHIPPGLKENVYFIINNEVNKGKKTNDKRSNFSDDCGIWESSDGSSPTSHYLLVGNGNLRKIYKKKNVYCWEKQVSKKRTYVPLEPQPDPKLVVPVQRYYAKLKEDRSYQKKVTYFGKESQYAYALVEYIGKFPGLSAHGNAKSCDQEYVRTPAHVMDEMGEMLKSEKPTAVYNRLKRKYDEVTRPSTINQVRKKKYREKVKNSEYGHHNKNNIADQIQVLENMVSENHGFVRCIIRDNNKTPCIILYSDEQILDLKNLCCTGHTVLGVDKTFNLCDMHVTVSCYKQLSVTRTRTDESPIFLGPVYLHDNSDFNSYYQFFSHLKMKLIDSDSKNLIIGTDDEKAMVKAIQTSFPESTHILCTRHLVQNAKQKLTDDAVTKTDRYVLIDHIFGENGIVGADDTICFDAKCSDFETECSEKSEKFLKHFQSKLKRQLKEKVNAPKKLGLIDSQWTNNNCESINHVLKQMNDWKSKPLTELVSGIMELVDGQFKELRSALVGVGDFRLAETHKRFQVSKSEWVSKNPGQRDRLYTRFRNSKIPDTRYVKSTDGQSNVVAPKTHGKKKNQTKRKVNVRTVTTKKAYRNPEVSDSDSDMSE